MNPHLVNNPYYWWIIWFMKLLVLYAVPLMGLFMYSWMPRIVGTLMDGLEETLNKGSEK